MALPIQRPTLLFTPGRTCPLEAVVLHAYPSGIEMLNLEMNRCPRPRPTAPRKCHDSFHFGLGNCNFTQYVPIDDTAWGFYLIPTPVCPEPPCPIVQTCDGIGVDQYNTDLDGNLPTPPAGVGPDGTANCAVIHVAISTGSANLSVCPEFTPQAYKCLVRDLCYIFDQAGLVPVSGDTLLTHIGELVDLDLDQLAIDIQECLDFVPPPLPPCECSVTITATDTDTIDFTALGNNITGSVIISSDAGNTLIEQNGLFVPADNITITATDTSCLDLTVTEAPANTFVITGSPVISPDAGNQISCSLNGLFVPESQLPLVDCDGADLVAGTPVVTVANLVDADVSELITPSILVSPVDVDSCPQILGAFSLCGELPDAINQDGANNNAGFHVLSQGPNDLAPRWRILGGGEVTVTVPTAIDVNSALEAGEKFIITTDDLTLNAPDSLCSRTELYIKNVGNTPITITGVGTTIDGQAVITLDGVIVAGYPFGNNGGESVHLVYSSSDAQWLVF